MSNKIIKVVVIGDVMGRTGRAGLREAIPRIKQQINPDIIVVNGENAAGGFGITKKIYDQFINNFEIDCVTMGNHWVDKKEIFSFIDSAEKMVIPANMPSVKSIDCGWKVLRSHNGVEFAAINLLGKAFMKNEGENPFLIVEKILERIPERIKIRIVDIHAEATSEKQGMGHLLTGRASLVFGTHCHVQTADERILQGQTGFITDIGMTGAQDSVVGMEKKAALRFLTTGEKKDFEPSKLDPWLCGILAEIDEITGYCVKIERIRWKLGDISES